MKRRNIRKISTEPNSYGNNPKNFPRIVIRKNATNKVEPTNIRSVSFDRTHKKMKERLAEPINFLQGEITRAINDVCFIVGGGPSLTGFDFSQLNGYDVIAVNKAVEYVHNPKYFITCDYS